MTNEPKGGSILTTSGTIYGFAYAKRVLWHDAKHVKDPVAYYVLAVNCALTG